MQPRSRRRPLSRHPGIRATHHRQAYLLSGSQHMTSHHFVRCRACTEARRSAAARYHVSHVISVPDSSAMLEPERLTRMFQ